MCSPLYMLWKETNQQENSDCRFRTHSKQFSASAAIGGTRMNEFTAFDSARNWVGFPVPRAVLLLCTRCRNKKEFLAYVPSDNWKFSVLLFVQSFTPRPIMRSFCSQSPLKKGNGSKSKAVPSQRQQQAVFHPVGTFITLLTNAQ